MNEQNKLTLTINNSFVKISDLSKTLKDIENEIQRQSGNTSDVCISEVRKGSMVFDLIQLANGILPLVEITNAIPVFIEGLKKCKDFLTYSNDLEDKNISIHSVETLTGMCNVISNGNGNASLTLNVNGSVYSNCTFILQQEEAKELKIKGERYLKQQREEEDTDTNIKSIENALIYFTQTNIVSEKADKAICEEISKKAIKILIPDKDIKEKILENPYGCSFIVNLKIQYKEGKPALYTITKYIEKNIDLED